MQPTEQAKPAAPTMGAAAVKTHFSQVLDRVEHHGETITITRHGEPIADIVPRRPVAVPSFKSWLLDGPKFPEGFELPERSDQHRPSPL